jgi:acid phosphatase type 7
MGPSGRLAAVALLVLFAVALATGWPLDHGSAGERAADPTGSEDLETLGTEREPEGAFGRSHSGPTVVWAIGDGADGSSAARSVARRIAAGRPDRLLYLGDVYEHGTGPEFSRNYRALYGSLDPRTAPTPGNHDWPSHREGYDPYWRKVTGTEPPTFYSFTAGGWQLMSLNSESPHDEGSRQLHWLRGQLAGAGDCRLAFWHRPRFSAGMHGDQPDVQPFWDALRGRARLVVNGHDHNMQRLRPKGGITELIAGAGGHGHYGLDPRYRGLAFHDTRKYGALRMSLRPGAARYAFVAASGRTLDSGTVRCRRR